VPTNVSWSKIVSALSRREVHAAWLKWLEYATVTAGVYVLAQHAWRAGALSTFLVALLWHVAAVVLYGAALVSETILVFQAYTAIEGVVLVEAGNVSVREQPITARVLVYGLGLLPLAITLFLVAAFQAALF